MSDPSYIATVEAPQNTAAVVERIVGIATVQTERATAVAVAKVERAVATAAAAQGMAGSVRRHTHDQASAASIWTVAHNLGFRPAVTVLSVGGVAVLAAVVHLSTDVLQVVFDEPFAGQAICN